MAEEFKALLGAELESGALDNIKKQISGLSDDPIQIGIELDLRETQRQLNSITKTFADLDRTMRGLRFENLFHNFNSSARSLDRVANTFSNLENTIQDIRNALGAINNDSGISSITDAVNEMNRATANATEQMRELIEITRNQNFNLNIQMGTNNTQAAYGRAARNSIAELRQQANAIEEAFRVATNAGRGYEAVFNSAAGTNQFGRLFELSNSIGDTSQSLRQQMDVYREYIAIMQEVARIRNIDLSGVTAGFARNANEIIEAAERYQDGTAQTEQNMERIRGIFGGGIGAEELVAQIDRVCNSLDEIRTSLNGLGENIRFDGLIEPFNRLTTSIENLLNNTVSLRGTLGGSMEAAGSSIGEVAQNAERLYDINLRTMAEHVNSVTVAMQGMGFSGDAISNVTRNFEGLRIAIERVQAATRRDGGIDLSIQGVGQGGERVYATRSYDNLGNFIEEARNPTRVVQSFNQIDNAAKELMSTIKKIGSLETKLIGLDPSKDQAQIEELRRELEALYLSFNRVFESNRSNFSTSQIDQLEEALQNSAEKVAILDAKLRDVSAAKLKNQIESINDGLDLGDFKKQLQTVQNSFDKVVLKTEDAKNAVKEFEAAFEAMLTAQKSGSNDDLIKSFEAFEKAKRKAENFVAIDAGSTKNVLTNEINTWLDKNKNAAAGVRQEVEKLRDSIEGLDAQGVKEARKKFEDLTDSVDSAKDSTINLQGVIVDLAAKYLSFADICNYIQRAFSAMYDNVLEIDTAMTNLYKVTDETANRYDKFLTTAAKKSKDLRRNMASYIKQTADWTKLGYTLDEAEQLSELSSIYANVGEVDDATAVSDMVTAMKAFNIEATDAVTIIDSLNELGNRFATNAADLGTGLTKSASAMNAAGADMHQTLAMLTGVTEITQNASEAGNFLKVASMRIRGMKGELEELGEEVDETVDSISKVQTQILNRTGGKINIFDDAGQFRNYYDIMKDIAAIWDDLSSTTQADLSEILFGKMRGNQGQALIQAFQSGQVEAALLASSIESVGSAMEEQEKWMDSLEAKLGSLDAVVQSISNNILDSDLLKFGIDALTGLASVIDAITNKLGSFGTLLLAAPIGVFLGNTVKGLSEAAKAATEAKEDFNLFKGIGEAAGKSLENMVSGLGTFKTKLAENVTSLGTFKGAIATAFQTHPILTAIAVVAALVAVIDLATTSAGEAAENFNNAVGEYESAKQKVVDINTELETTKTKIDELQAKGGLTFVEQAELERLQKATAELELQAKFAEQEEIRAAKKVAATATEAYQKNYANWWHGGKIDQSKIDREVDFSGNYGEGLVYLYDDNNLNSLIAASEIYAKQQEEAYKAANEIIDSVNNGSTPIEELDLEMRSQYDMWALYKEQCDLINTELWKDFQELNKYKTEIEAIPESLRTSDQNQVLKSITADWEYLYKLLDPAGWKTFKFDELFNDTVFSDAKEKLVGLAAANKAVGISVDEVKETFGESYEQLLRLLNNADLTVHDLINVVNSEAQTYKPSEIKNQITEAYAEDNELQTTTSVVENVETTTIVNGEKVEGFDLAEYLANQSAETIKLLGDVISKEKELNPEFTLEGFGEEDFDALIESAVNDTEDSITFSQMVNNEDYQNTLEDTKEKASALLSAIAGEDSVDYEELSQLFGVPINAKTSKAELQRLLQILESDMHQFVLDWAKMAENESEKAKILAQETNWEDWFTLDFVEVGSKRASEVIDNVNNLFTAMEDGLKREELRDLAIEMPELEIDYSVPEDQLMSQATAAVTKMRQQIVKYYAEALVGVTDPAGQKEILAAMHADLSIFDQYVEEASKKKLDMSKMSELRDSISGLQDDLSDVILGELTDADKANLVVDLLNNHSEMLAGAGITDLNVDNLESNILKLIEAYKLKIREAFKTAADALDPVKDASTIALLKEAEQAYLDAIAENMPSAGDAKLYSEKIAGYISDIENVQDIFEDKITKQELMDLSYQFPDLNIDFTVPEDQYEAEAQKAIEAIRAKVNKVYDEAFYAANDLDSKLKILSEQKATNAVIDGLGVDIDESAVETSIENIELLYESLEKISANEFKAEDLFNLQEVFGEAINPDDLEGSINTAINSTIKLMDDAFDRLIATSSDPEKWAALKETAHAMIKEMAEVPAATFDMEAQTEGFDALRTAIEESTSAVGLSAESIESLKKRYEELKSFDPAKLFEYTENGIHLNREALEDLEKEYDKASKTKLASRLEELNRELAESKAKFGNAERGTEAYANALKEVRSVEEIEKDIQNTRMLTIQYGALTSAYQKWVESQSGPKERDSYEDVGDSYEEMKQILDMGWYGDESLNDYLDLMLSGKERTGNAIDDFAKLKEKIGDTGHSIMDYWDFDDEGNLSTDGLFKFLKDVNKEMGDGFAWQEENGSWSFDFTGSKLQELADEFGMSTELIELFARALIDAGANVTFDPSNNIEGLQELDENINTVNSALEKLGEEKVEINVDASTTEELTTEIDKAKQAVNSLTNEDGTIKAGVSQEEYEAAIAVLNTLAEKKAYLEAPTLMSVQVDESDGVSELESGIQLLQALNTQLQIGADTSESQTKLNDILTQLNGLSEETKVQLGLDDTSFTTAVETITETKIGVAVDQTALDTVQSTIKNVVEGKIVALGLDSQEIDNYTVPTKTGTVVYSYDDVAVRMYTPPTKFAKVVYTTEGPGPANGTAHANGTAFSNGTAYRHGDWGTHGSGVALGGELGVETVVRDGRYFTIGDNGAEFFRYKKGDIIFNHKQTEELFKYGKVTSGGGRAKAFAEGTAFAKGTGASERPNSGSSGSSSGGKKNNSSSSSSSSSSDDYEEIFDWIETAIDRIERKIDGLDRTAGNVYKNWSDRNKNLRDEMKEVANEIDLQNQAANRYLEEANSVGLAEKWAKLVREGAIDIDTITDEDLADKIQQYQEWYDKYLDCIDAAEELKVTESELYQQAFDNIVTQYEGFISVIEQEKSLLEEYISQAEEQGQIASTNYYQALIASERNNLSQLESEREALIASLNEAVASGKIDEGSEAWYEMVGQINDVTLAIAESETAMLEYNNAIRDIEWQVFDLMQEKISQVSSEADFLISLLENDKLYNDKGQLTDEGMATMAMHGMNYNTYMHQADEYAKEMARINAELANDPNNQDLLNRKQELLELQQESILAAEDEKQAIIDMVSEGIQLELDALKELIDSYTDALDAEKSLYDYQKKVKGQVEEIASLEKQLAAYAGDQSEEAKLKLQEIRVSLEDARENLEETEYERYISDQKELLDKLYDDYDEVLNSRLDNVDALLEDMISTINANAETIHETLTTASGDVGYTLSSTMTSIWGEKDATGKITNAIGIYGLGINSEISLSTSRLTTALNTINSSVQEMVSAWNAQATAQTNTGISTGAANGTGTAGTGVDAGTNTGSGANGETMAEWHSANSSDESHDGYQNTMPDLIDTVTRSNNNSQYLTDLTEDIALDIKEMAGAFGLINHSSRDILDELGVDRGTSVASANVGGNNTATNTVTVEITLPNVTNYDEFKQKMQRDKSFENMLRAMTTDRMFGGSSLKKYRY